MLKERLQILITAEQRRVLESEAARQETSVAALIREAIDERYGAVSREDRRRAVGEIAGMEGGYVDPAELARMIDEERDEVARGLDLPQPG
jgi:hypothetical protein